jgi:hypothetical protein
MGVGGFFPLFRVGGRHGHTANNDGLDEDKEMAALALYIPLGRTTLIFLYSRVDRSVALGSISTQEKKKQ